MKESVNGEFVFLRSVFLKAEHFLEAGNLSLEWIITGRLHHFKECSLPLYYGFNDEFREKFILCSLTVDVVKSKIVDVLKELNMQSDWAERIE